MASQRDVSRGENIADGAPLLQIMAERYKACAAQFINIGNMKIAYHVEGPANAPVVVLIHGALGSRKTWISPSAPENVRLIAITRPGYDESDDVDLESYGYDVVVSIVKAVLDKLSVQNFHVIGHSAGGPSALAVKAMMPDRCMRCIILSSVCDGATNPKLSNADLGPCTPGRCCGGCGKCCFLPCVMKAQNGAICACSYTEHPITTTPSEAFLKELAEGDLDDTKKLGEMGTEWLACVEKASKDSIKRGFRLNGLFADILGQNKPWPFMDTLANSTFPGKDVEIWAGELDTLVKKEVGEYNQSLVPGSTLREAPKRGHHGMTFPSFMAERLASIAEVPAQEQMCP